MVKTEGRAFRRARTDSALLARRAYGRYDHAARVFARALARFCAITAASRAPIPSALASASTTGFSANARNSRSSRAHSRALFTPGPMLLLLGNKCNLHTHT